MLTHLRIRHLAVIDELSLDLGPGLQVVTGETGAGKSMLVDALQLVLGARARSDMVRTGCEHAEVEALIELHDDPVGRARLREELGDDDDELVVRREIRASGRSRAFVNGRLVTARQLDRLLGPLIDVCSQHEHHALSDPGRHLETLDHFADLDDARTAMAAAFARFREAAATAEAIAAALRARADREAIVRFHLAELDDADPQDGELGALEEDHGRLAHATALADATRAVADEVYADDDSLVARLTRAVRRLDDVRGVDPVLDALLPPLDDATTMLEDAAAEIGRYAGRVVDDPVRLAAVEERLAVLRRLVKRHGGTWAAMWDRRAALRDELAELDRADERLEEAEATRQRAADDAVSRARTLSAARREAARALGEAITSELQDLGMGGARVEVELARLDARGDDLEVDGARVASTGMDRAELLIAPNVGEEPRPLRRIASGGELSRALLAIKRVVGDQGSHRVQVFDEVDAGIGGQVADAVGRKLATIATARQVVCITHLPQIAVYGARHLHVSKETVDGRTRSRVARLEDDGRVEEIARMLGGASPDDAVRAAARALLRDARSA